MTILQGDVREIVRQLPAASVHCIVTSPPYWGLRDYGHADQIGLESTPDEYVQTMVELFRELRRVLRDDGTLWLNLGDSYIGYKGANYGINPENSNLQKNSKVPTAHEIGTPASGLAPKNLVGIPWRVALALQADGWILRSDIIWAKPNPMPESVTDRPTKSHEYIFLLAKSERYFYDAEAIKEDGITDDRQRQTWENRKYSEPMRRGDPGLSNHITHTATLASRTGRNRRTVWTVATTPYNGAHFATFPPALIEPCILAGCPAQVCSECGKPWERVVERAAATPGQRIGYTSNPGTLRNDGERAGSWTNMKYQTLGFRPTCACNASTTAGVVLDPFIGSGTVGQVAIETGRQWLGIELNPEYVKLAEDRIAAAQPALMTPTGEPAAMAAKQWELF